METNLVKSQDVAIGDEIITLLPEKGAYWESRNILFISDLHLGKAASFRNDGLPIPHGTTDDDLQILSKLVSTLSISQIFILGDLMHSLGGRSEKLDGDFLRWRTLHNSLAVTLVRGNHDRRAGDPPKDWQIECVSEPHLLSPFICAHDFVQQPEQFGIQGHIHPRYFVGEKRRGGKHFPCFVKESKRLILPAFGSFTGGFSMPPTLTTVFYPIIEGQVYKAA